jgi:hypothetical protein
MAKANQGICVWLTKKDRILLKLMSSQQAASQSQVIRAAIRAMAIKLEIIKIDDLLDLESLTNS